MTNATSVAGSGTTVSVAPAEATPDRRTFLVQAASGLVLAATAGTAMGSTIDPIFAAIENHKAANRDVEAVVSEHSRLEAILPRDKCKSSINAWEEKIVETDDPRWIENECAVRQSFEAETDAACVLVSICPTTIAGVIALLRYANTADKDGEAWPTTRRMTNCRRGPCLVRSAWTQTETSAVIL
jgi:hypothetical protein